MTAGAPETPPKLLSEPLMTLRVSRDSGRTWGARQAVYGAGPLLTGMWPPCECPRCLEQL